MRNATNESGDVSNAANAISSILSRDPTCYRPLHTFFFSIPDRQSSRGGELRWLAKQRLKGMVPNMLLKERCIELQAADLQMRLGRQRKELFAEIGGLTTRSKMTAMLNFPGFRMTLDNWSTKAPIDDSAAQLALQFALLRACRTARFIRYFEGAKA